MHCTGGIRCKKASAYFKHQGFKTSINWRELLNTPDKSRKKALKEFIGKNFCSTDHRLGERITDWYYFAMSPMRKNLATITRIAQTTLVIVSSFNVMTVKRQWKNCCSNECQEIIHLPVEEQVVKKGCRLEK